MKLTIHQIFIFLVSVCLYLLVFVGSYKQTTIWLIRTQNSPSFFLMFVKFQVEITSYSAVSEICWHIRVSFARNATEWYNSVTVWTGPKPGTIMDWTRVNSQLFRSRNQTGTLPRTAEDGLLTKPGFARWGLMEEAWHKYWTMPWEWTPNHEDNPW